MDKISEKIKAARIAKGVTIEEVAEATLLSVNIIKDIEDGAFERFVGDELYVKMYLKKIARYLEIDETIADDYYAITREIKKADLKDLENKKEELEKNLYSKNVYLILYNKIEIKEIIKLIKNKKEDENEKIKKEINDLKKIIIEQNSKNKQNKKQKIKEVKELNLQKEIICILGSGGVGKSIFTVNLAKSLIYSKKKILIIDFDILNNSLHTILGVKKYSEKISKKIKENNLIKDKIGLKELKIKINKRIDLISGINLLFDSKYKINNIQFNNLFNDVKKFYDVIIIDTSSECFFNYTKDIIKKSNINIFIVEPNLLEIQKSKNILKIYKEEWNIDNNEINILFNKFNKNSIDINILKIIFSEYNIIGKIDINNKYNLIINKNANKIDKNIKKEYLKIIEKYLINRKKQNFIKKIKNKILEVRRSKNE